MNLMCMLFGHKMSAVPRLITANVGTYLAYCCERKKRDGTTACFHRVPASQNDATQMTEQARYTEWAGRNHDAH